MGIVSGIDNAQLKKLLSTGHTEKFAQEFFSIPAPTWSEWKRKNPAFKKFIDECKAEADSAVQHALFKRATGFVASEIVHYRDKQSDAVIPYENTKEYPPDVTACIHWLERRCKEEWGEEKKKDPAEGLFAGANITVQKIDLEERINQIRFGEQLENALR